MITSSMDLIEVLHLRHLTLTLFTQAHIHNASLSQQNSMKDNSFTAATEAERKTGHRVVPT